MRSPGGNGLNQWCNDTHDHTRGLFFLPCNEGVGERQTYRVARRDSTTEPQIFNRGRMKICTAPVRQKNRTGHTGAMCATASALVRWKMHRSRITVYGFIIIIIYFVL